MLNLIRKDLVLQKPTLMIMIPLLIVFLFLESSSIWGGIIFSIAIIMNAYSIDEKSSINMLLNSLPYTRKEIVSSKYIGAFISIALVVITIFFSNLIIHQEITVWKDILVIVSLAMVAISFIFPFSYKFKSQYMLIGSLALLAIYLVIIPIFIPNVNDIMREFVQSFLTLENIQIYLLIGFSIFTLYAVSWLLSIRIYGKKTF